MAKQTINQGTVPTGAGGDTFRTGSAKLQANDNELYAQLGATAQGVLPAALPISKGGTGATTAAAARANLELGSAALYNIGLEGGQVITVGNSFGLGWSGSRLGYRDFTQFLTAINGKSQFVGLEWIDSGEVAPYSAGIYAQAQDTYLYIAAGPFSNSKVVGISGAGLSVQPFQFRTSRDTWVDGNGFLKAASPIIKLFADKIELNDEAQLQEITFEKLGVGDYLIKGSSGFAQEGWYIETPKDANGNVLFSVIYETLENGDISAKTYKKKFDFETVSIVADLDNPVDITENRWIDLRLQELPQPELQIPESIAPPDFQPTGLAEAVATVMESYHDPEQ